MAVTPPKGTYHERSSRQREDCFAAQVLSAIGRHRSWRGTGRHACHAGYAGEDNTIKIALVGCGGRGTGAAAQALHPGPHQTLGHGRLLRRPPADQPADLNASSSPSRSTCPPERQFIGLDGYKKAIDSLDRAAWCCWPRRRPSGPSTWNTPWPRAARVHGEIVRRGRPGRSPRAEGRRRGRRRRTSRSPAA